MRTLAVRVRLRQNARKMGGPVHHQIRGDEHLHGKFRRDPRSAAAAPAGPIGHVDFEPQPVRLGDGKAKQLLPFGIHEIRGAGRRGEAFDHVHDDDAANARALHRFEVGGDAGLGDVAVVPKPINPRPGRGRRRGELCREITGKQRRQSTNSEESGKLTISFHILSLKHGCNRT